MIYNTSNIGIINQVNTLFIIKLFKVCIFLITLLIQFLVFNSEYVDRNADITSSLSLKALGRRTRLQYLVKFYLGLHWIPTWSIRWFESFQGDGLMCSSNRIIVFQLKKEKKMLYKNFTVAFFFVVDIFQLLKHLSVRNTT